MDEVDNAQRWSRGALRWVLAVGLIPLAALLSACLGPDEFDPTGTAPLGRLDLVHADGASIRLVGWALDPDTRASIDVVISVRQQTSTHRANLSRPDVARAYPSHGPNHGFDIRTEPLPAGVNQVCIWAPNVGRGTRDRMLGCADVRTGTDDPVGSFESLERVNATTIRARGWAYDPDAGRSITVSPFLNGSQRPAVTADRDHAVAVSTVQRRGRYGFSVELTVVPGDHRVCFTARNVGRGRDRSLGCRDIRVNSIPVLQAGNDLSTVKRVGPAPGNPLHRIDRDAGISVTMSDGSLVWLFGDSTEKDASGAYRYFVNNTVAWAAAHAPTQTLDAVVAGPSPRPFRFVAPVAPFSSPCPAGTSEVMWPVSGVAVPLEDGRDRLLAYFGNVCLSSTVVQSRGVALVEWVYDPAAPPAGLQMAGTVLNQELFPVGLEYGTASVLHEGLIHVYQCGRPGDDRPAGVIIWPDDPAYSGCTVGRVDPGSAHDPDAYEFWAGGDQWQADRDAAVVMELPPGPDGHRRTPMVSFSVVDDPHHGWTMVYSPWPGFTEEIAVRSGAGPTGPWSDWQIARAPGCYEWADGSERLCYAATAQPWNSTATHLGVGYYDHLIALGPARGSYLAARTPFQRLAVG